MDTLNNLTKRVDGNTDELGRLNEDLKVKVDELTSSMDDKDHLLKLALMDEIAAIEANLKKHEVYTEEELEKLRKTLKEELSITFNVDLESLRKQYDSLEAELLKKIKKVQEAAKTNTDGIMVLNDAHLNISAAINVAEKHLAEIDAKIKELEAFDIYLDSANKSTNNKAELLEKALAELREELLALKKLLEEKIEKLKGQLIGGHHD